MAKGWIKITVHDYGLTEIEGDCEMCKAFPCEHTDEFWNYAQISKVKSGYGGGEVS